MNLTYDGWYFLAEMWNRVSPLAECAAILLVFMFVAALVEGLARGASYGAAVRQSRSFLRITQRPLENGDWDELLASARLRKRSHVATVFAAGLLEGCAAAAGAGAGGPAQSWRRPHALVGSLKGWPT